MPLYELICDCGHVMEQVLKIDEKEPVCEKCGLQMRRAISAPAFILKGNGWYKDGYGLHTKKENGGKKNA